MLRDILEAEPGEKRDVGISRGKDVVCTIYIEMKSLSENRERY